MLTRLTPLTGQPALVPSYEREAPLTPLRRAPRTPPPRKRQAHALPSPLSAPTQSLATPASAVLCPAYRPEAQLSLTEAQERAGLTPGVEGWQAEAIELLGALTNAGRHEFVAGFEAIAGIQLSPSARQLMWESFDGLPVFNAMQLVREVPRLFTPAFTATDRIIATRQLSLAPNFCFRETALALNVVCLHQPQPTVRHEALAALVKIGDDSGRVNAAWHARLAYGDSALRSNSNAVIRAMYRVPVQKQRRLLQQLGHLRTPQMDGTHLARLIALLAEPEVMAQGQRSARILHTLRDVCVGWYASDTAPDGLMQMQPALFVGPDTLGAQATAVYKRLLHLPTPHLEKVLMALPALQLQRLLPALRATIVAALARHEPLDLVALVTDLGRLQMIMPDEHDPLHARTLLAWVGEPRLVRTSFARCLQSLDIYARPEQDRVLITAELMRVPPLYYPSFVYELLAFDRGTTQSAQNFIACVTAMGRRTPDAWRAADDSESGTNDSEAPQGAQDA